MRVPHKIPGDRRVKDSAGTVVTERSVLQIGSATVTEGVSTAPVEVEVVGGGDEIAPPANPPYTPNMVLLQSTVSIDSTPDTSLNLGTVSSDWDGTDFLTGYTDFAAGELFFNTRGLYEFSAVFNRSVWPVSTERFSIYALTSKAAIPGSSSQMTSGASYEKGRGTNLGVIQFSFTDYFEADDGFLLKQRGANSIVSPFNLYFEATIKRII
jgi:hypothetical protein